MSLQMHRHEVNLCDSYDCGFVVAGNSIRPDTTGKQNRQLEPASLSILRRRDASSS